MSSNQPTPGQQAQAAAAVNKVMSAQPWATRGDAARRAADAIAAGYPCDPDAGRTDHLVRHLFH